MHRAPLGQLAMDGGNLNDHQQSMSQLLQSCTALHAVANNNQENHPDSMSNSLQMRKLSSNHSTNDENRGPNASPPVGSALHSTTKADLVDMSQLSAIRKNRVPTMSRRNERERNRVRYLNFTFDVLRQHLPGKGGKGKAKKMSKVDTLRGAIDYIHDLQLLLGDEDEGGRVGGTSTSGGEGGNSSLSQTGTESEGDSLSPSGSPHYSGGSPGGVGHHDDPLSDQEEELNALAGWFC